MCHPTAVIYRAGLLFEISGVQIFVQGRYVGLFEIYAAPVLHVSVPFQLSNDEFISTTVGRLDGAKESNLDRHS